jgi:hypothetical protein
MTMTIGFCRDILNLLYRMMFHSSYILVFCDLIPLRSFITFAYYTIAFYKIHYPRIFFLSFFLLFYYVCIAILHVGFMKNFLLLFHMYSRPPMFGLPIVLGPSVTLLLSYTPPPTPTHFRADSGFIIYI